MFTSGVKQRKTLTGTLARLRAAGEHRATGFIQRPCGPFTQKTSVNIMIRVWDGQGFEYCVKFGITSVISTFYRFLYNEIPQDKRRIGFC